MLRIWWVSMLWIMQASLVWPYPCMFRATKYSFYVLPRKFLSGGLASCTAHLQANWRALRVPTRASNGIAAARRRLEFAAGLSTGLFSFAFCLMKCRSTPGDLEPNSSNWLSSHSTFQKRRPATSPVLWRDERSVEVRGKRSRRWPDLLGFGRAQQARKPTKPSTEPIRHTLSSSLGPNISASLQASQMFG